MNLGALSPPCATASATPVRLRVRSAPARGPARLCARAVAVDGGRVGGSASFYELLGIGEGVGLEEIKKAYKQMARKYHPDVSPPDLAEEHTRRFIELQVAYETLSDPDLRALYDRDLARGIQLALSARWTIDPEMEEKSSWKNRWQDQLNLLKRRSTNKDSSMENLSWGARMRKQNNGSSAE